VALPTDATVFAQLETAMKRSGLTSDWWLGMYAASNCVWTSLSTGATATFLDWYPYVAFCRLYAQVVSPVRALSSMLPPKRAHSPT
jgi:hypothetical protein